MRSITPRMIQRHMIDRNGKTFNTSIEQDFQAFINEHRLPFKQNESRDFQALNRRLEMQTFTFQMDFVEFADPAVFPAWKATGYLPTNAQVKTDLETDGKDHKDANDPWKDAIKARSGIRVVHIPGFLCRKKMWPELKIALDTARRQPEMVQYLDEYSR